MRLSKTLQQTDITVNNVLRNKLDLLIISHYLIERVKKKRKNVFVIKSACYQSM